MESIDLKKVQKIYFVGIGGIGMSALAQLFLFEGKTVLGSDRDASPTTELLLRKGVAVSIGHTAALVTRDVGLLIYSDAIPEDNPERIIARQLGIPELSYFETLGLVSKDKFTLAVTGTHGKTTTTGMLAKILADGKKQPTAIVGSIMKDFDSNFLAGSQDLFVVEACEYRDHLLLLHPNILVLTNVEWDHTDWFLDLAAVQETFRKAAQRLPGNGVLVTNPSDPNITPILSGLSCTIVDYTKELVPALSLIGEFNVMNARAAKAAARSYAPDIPEGVIDVSLRKFKGTWRRFEYKGKTREGSVVYDDYAHHPTAVRKTIEAASMKFPDKRITVVFHPHLYSRTKDLMEEFSKAFDSADSVIIAPIYAAREKPIKGVSNLALADIIHKHNGKGMALDSFEEIERTLHKTCNEKDLILTMGAGDIYKVAEALTHSTSSVST